MCELRKKIYVEEIKRNAMGKNCKKILSFYLRFFSKRAMRRNEENLWRIPNFILLLLNFAAGRHYTLFSSSSTCEKSCKNVRFHFLIYILSTSRKTFFVHEGSNEEEPYMRVRECLSKVNVTSFIYSSIKIISITHLYGRCVTSLYSSMSRYSYMRAFLLNSVFFVATYFFPYFLTGKLIKLV